MSNPLSTKYDPRDLEEKWYELWQKEGIFNSQPDDREPYTIVMPPPNVTGVLHMGHILNNTIQDILIRRALMLGKNACWVPGTDHASIATEAKVVALLAEKGIKKSDISREEFLEYAKEWKDNYGGRIIEQLKKLGVACDWNRTTFTMDDDYYQSVIKIFVDLYNKGFIYKGIRMINYDPKGKTALSDIEIVYKEINQSLHYIRYYFVEEPDQYMTIATTRPETIMADVALCVNPEDERYCDFIGKKVRIPLINKEIPIIADTYVDKDFGTGCLKITPAHDINDYEIGQKHNLEVIDIIDDEGKLNDKAQIFVGVDRFKARREVVEKLKEEGHWVKTEEYLANVGFSERTNEVVEPKLSMQWFCKMEDISKEALQCVLDKEVNLIPDKFTNTYRHWMENIKDWCISRQLWWGQRIPAWYAPDGSIAVAEDENRALEILREKDTKLTLADIRQDEDVLDTWFSSWAWPVGVFDGVNQPENKDIEYYYPTSDLVTGPDILFFWVARMIVFGYYSRGKAPFKNVYLTGLIRDKQRRKMSKSLGNSPEPIELMNTYGVDGVRIGILLSASAGNDLMFDEALCEQGRNFCNKLWNAFRLIKGWEVVDKEEDSSYFFVHEWLENKLHSTIQSVNHNLDQYRISDALMSIYRFVWDDFCSWYLEAIKPLDREISKTTMLKTLDYFKNILQLLHPFSPFITEELWNDDIFKDSQLSKSICLSAYPKADENKLISHPLFEEGMKLIVELRNLRNTNQVPNRVDIDVFYKNQPDFEIQKISSLIEKLAKATLEHKQDMDADVPSCLIGKNEFWIDLKQEGVSKENEAEELKKELEHLQGFLRSVNAKLSNERFVQNAKPEIVEREKQKQADAEQKIKAIEARLGGL